MGRDLGQTEPVSQGDVMTEKLDLEISRKSPELTLKIENRSEEGGTTNYNRLSNKPSIEGVTLQGDKTFPQLGLGTLSVQEIERILYLD